MFTALLNSVTRSPEPSLIWLRVTYSDSEHPDWGELPSIVTATLDPALEPAQQRLAVRNQVIADGQRYLAQFLAYDGLTELVGTSIVISQG